MTLQQLKKLSEKRIINMKALYERAGISTSSMNSRLSLMNGALSEQESRALALAVALQIEEIVETLELPASTIAHTLDIQPADQNSLDSVEPCAYFRRSKEIRPIYLISDKIRPRKSNKGTGPAMFWQLDRLIEAFVTNGDIEPTERGRQFLGEER